MKFSIGDRIILKRTGEEGFVVSFISAQMMEVNVSGTTFPVYTDEVDHPYLTWFTQKNKEKKVRKAAPEQLPVEKEKARPARLARGVYLSFLPVYKLEEMEDVVDQLKVYLMNELPQTIHFRYDVRTPRENKFHHEGTLHGFGHLYLHHIDFSEMNDQPRFHWALDDAEHAESLPADGILRIRPARLFEQIHELQLKNEPMFSYLLISDFKVLSGKPADPVPVLPAKDLPPPPRPAVSGPAAAFPDLPPAAVDLHIEQILTDYKGLSNWEILEIQLNTLRHSLQVAIAHRQERLVVIHGLGTGTLRDSVHKILRETAEVASFSNEWHGRYGFGATEVTFRYG